MAIRYDDRDRILSLSVRDLVEGITPRGHLVLEVVQTRQARMAAGRRVHIAYQNDRASEDPDFQAEVPLKVQRVLREWTVVLTGRVDGLSQAPNHTVVEEIKSTALDIDRLMATTLDAWPSYVAQLEVYLWMLNQAGYPPPIGQLVQVSLADGSRHILPVRLDAEQLDRFIDARLIEMIEAREQRLAWYAARASRRVNWPFAAWRGGQEAIRGRTQKAIDEGQPLFVEAPTGLGKTASVLHGVLERALATHKQVFWATTRNTQQTGVIQTVARFRDAGLPLRSIQLRAREKACLNDVVACRPDTCPYAANYFDKVAQAKLIPQLTTSETHISAEDLAAAGRRHEVCPVQLALDLSECVDVVVGDYNYAFSPSTHLRRHFSAEAADGWLVVADEVHQLVDRARGYFSPRVELSEARAARDLLTDDDPDIWQPFIELADDIELSIRDVIHRTHAAGAAIGHDGSALAEISVAPWRQLATRIDEIVSIFCT